MEEGGEGGGRKKHGEGDVERGGREHPKEGPSGGGGVRERETGRRGREGERRESGMKTSTQWHLKLKLRGPPTPEIEKVKRMTM